MGRTSGRTADDTRRLVIDAASSVITQHGLSATLDDIARAAGVSKGGLIYHFGSKDALVEAVCADLIDGFRSAVEAAVEPTETKPGRLTRGYIRASLDSTIDAGVIRDYIALTAQLLTSPQAAELIRNDSKRWAEELAADGLPPDVLTLVVAAADGASLAPMWGGLAGTQHYDDLRDRLITLTLVADPFESPGT